MAPAAIGGTGVVGLVIYLAITLLGGGTTTGPSSNQMSLGQGSGQNLSASCQTGADANQRQDCRLVGVVNSVQDHWQGTMRGYRKAPTQMFTGSVSTGCGTASSAVGPFYCPTDETIYIDLGFYEELRTQFGAKGGPFAEAYVIAHEYAHHVQHVIGTDQQVGREEGPTSGSVRLELQADCYAGVWASHALETGFITELSDADIAAGLDASAAIGDDRIQQSATGRVNPESFTHGSSEQRQRWFSRGYETGRAADCDTFATNQL